MTERQYKSAPVSEVILGLTFSTPHLLTEGLIFILLGELVHDYPSLQFGSPTMPSELFKNGMIESASSEQWSGDRIYRLKSADKRWIVQLQWNKIYLHWDRPDDIEKPDYPGFSVLLERFNQLLERICKTVPFDEESIYGLELSYLDRSIFPMSDDILQDLENLTCIKNPKFSFMDKVRPTSGTIQKYTLPIDEFVHGFFSIHISHLREKSGDALLDILSFLFVLRSALLPGETIDDWFRRANIFQIKAFESFFKKETLDQWKA